jgi:hypothetical protein
MFNQIIPNRYNLILNKMIFKIAIICSHDNFILGVARVINLKIDNYLLESLTNSTNPIVLSNISNSTGS